MKTKRLLKKIICLTACLGMLLGSTVTASAKMEIDDAGNVFVTVDPPVEGMTQDVIRNIPYSYVYYSKDGGRTDTELAGIWEIPQAGPDGSPLFLRPYTGLKVNDLGIVYGETDVLSVYECIGTTPGGVRIYVDWSTFYLDDQVAFLLAMIDNTGVTNEMSEYDKCVAIANYVCDVMYYDKDENGIPGALKHKMLDSGNPDRPTDFNNDPAAEIVGDGLNCVYWLGGAGVCEDYADLFQTMCETIGIKCEVIKSFALTHAWNEVLADGKTYYVDVTWMDTGRRSREYLMSETLWPDHKDRWAFYEGYDDIYNPVYTLLAEGRKQAIAVERYRGRTLALLPYVPLTNEEYWALQRQMGFPGIRVNL